MRSFNRMIMELEANRREIEERKAFIEAVIESVATGVISIDRDGTITTVNSSAKQILGLEENIVGKRYWEALSRPEYEELYEIVKEIAREPVPVEKREITIHKGGTKHLLVSATTIKGKDKKWAGTVIVLEDITELVKAQRAQAWEEVARRMAHEIKNPLTPIGLSAQRIKRKISKKQLTDADREAIEKSSDAIVKSVQSIKKMVDAFSRFAKLPEIELAPCDLKEIVQESIEMYRENKKVDFEVHFSENLPKKLLLDREQMKRVFLNLIDNAIHAIDGKGKISISAYFNPEKRTVVIEVADTGCGIPDEYKDKLFQPYFSKRKGGTGLGLAIVDRIIADHGGYIRVRDNTPKGTVFTIELPYREAA